MTRRVTEEQKAAMQAGRASAKKGETAENNSMLTVSEKETVSRVSAYLPSAKKAFLKAFTGRAKAAAIKAKCIECSNLERKEVELCQVGGCPLYRYRPYGRKEAANG